MRRKGGKREMKGGKRSGGKGRGGDAPLRKFLDPPLAQCEITQKVYIII